MILKSAWQLAKELVSDYPKSEVNSIKIEIIRAGKKGIIKEYTYHKNGKTLKLYSESEAKGAFDLAKKLGNFQIEAISYQLTDGQWVPKLEVAENKGSSIDIMTWVWDQKRFPTKDTADKYARASGLYKLRKMIGDTF